MKKLLILVITSTVLIITGCDSTPRDRYSFKGVDIGKDLEADSVVFDVATNGTVHAEFHNVKARNSTNLAQIKATYLGSIWQVLGSVLPSMVTQGIQAAK